jgi:hypothetical protein
MKYLTDSEILKWSEKIQEINLVNGGTLFLVPRFTHYGPNPVISYKWKKKVGLFEEVKDIPDPSTSFEYSFSVTSNRVDDFFDILKKIRKEEFGTKSMASENHTSVIEVTDEIIKNKAEIKHWLGKKEYTRFTWRFSGKIGSIIAWISYIEDAIDFFSMMWGYHEDGSEVSLMKFPISSIVSLKSDRSREFMVVDYYFTRGNGTKSILYVTSEITEIIGMVVKFKQNTLKYSEEELCWSRNDRIDDVLNS